VYLSAFVKKNKINISKREDIFQIFDALSPEDYYRRLNTKKIPIQKQIKSVFHKIKK
jgi:hypothetical protein